MSVNVNQVTLYENSGTQVGRGHQFFGRWKTTSFFGKWKTTYIFFYWKTTYIFWKMEDNLNFLTMEDELNCFGKMEDDINLK